MPIQRIEVSEYQCIHCSYKWINRANGKDENSLGPPYAKEVVAVFKENITKGKK
jgi:hypothetical protein